MNRPIGMNKAYRANAKVMVDGIETTRYARDVTAMADAKLIRKLHDILHDSRIPIATAMATMAYMIGEQLAFCSDQAPDGETETLKKAIHGVIDLSYSFSVKKASEIDESAKAYAKAKARKRT